MTQTERLHFLLDYLLRESDYGAEIQIPKEIPAQKRLLRALMNLRAPGAVSEAFIKVQDIYLQTETSAKGITDADSLVPIRDRLCLWQGDITMLKCGAIVNAANSALLGCFVPCHGCIDNAIHTYAGVRLRAECADIMDKQGFHEPPGKAKMTRAYNLPCSYVIHTVGPIVQGALTEENCALLKSCYVECLKKAEEYAISSIAFCCISTGEFHFPNERAAEIAVDTVTKYLNHSTIEKVIFNVFRDRDKEIYTNLLR